MNYLTNFINIKNDIKNQNTKNNLIVVTKNVDIEKIKSIIDLGQVDFGENRVKDASIKWSNLLKSQNNKFKLHLIGRLQSNKVKDAIKIFDYIHTLDSTKLALLLDNEEKLISKKLKYFIQVNIGNEVQKNGVLEKDLFQLLDYCRKSTNLDVIGLMCIPPLNKDPNFYFKNLQELAYKNNLTELSCGMSSDYSEAIKFGSTYTRIGSKIFS
jgi:pyridoxal phosphate enzyme (YggS family)